jgi:GNAT superfamily N-acetyltransferase
MLAYNPAFDGQPPVSRYQERENGVNGISTSEGLRPRNLKPDIVRLRPEHAGELSRLLCALDPLSRCGRFNHAVSDVYLAGHASRAVAEATCVLGAIVDGHLRGVVEVYVDGPRGCAEAAFVVAKDWRQRGLGLALLQAAIVAAQHADAGKLRMIFSRHNWPMRKLADKASGRLDLVLDELAVDVALAQSCCSCRPRSAQLPAIGDKHARSTARES